MSPRCRQVAKILKTMSPLLCLQLLTGCSARHPMGLTPVAVRLAGAVPDVVLAAGVGERAPLLLRSFLGLDPHVPHKKVTVCPQLPTAWGRVTLTDLRLGAITVHFEAEGETVKTL